MNNINDKKYHLYLYCGGFSADDLSVAERCEHVHLDSRFIYHVQLTTPCHLGTYHPRSTQRVQN